MSCQILQRQSTFWDLEDGDGLVRVHFVGKEEFNFSHRFADSFAIIDDHPVLLDYRVAWASIFVSGSAPSPEQTMALVERTIEPLLSGWRSAYSYLTATDPLRMLREGYGQFLNGPEPIASAAAAVLSANGVPIKVLAGRAPRWPRRALVAGANFVIATDFRVESVVT
jgi:hypothetical protein